MNNLTKKLHDWSLQQANTKWGGWALFLCAFAEASVLGLPTPILFLGLALLNPDKIKMFASAAILGTMAGSVAGYSIGHFAWLDTNGEFTRLAQFMFNNIPGEAMDGYNKIKILYETQGFWVLFTAAALPLPYKIFSISSGVFDINIFIFSLATFISQGLKFFVLALLTIKLGPELKKLLEYNWKPILITAGACIILAILAIKIF